MFSNTPPSSLLICFSLRSAAAWNLEDCLFPLPLPSLSSGNVSMLALSTTGLLNSTVTVKALNTLCMWWPKERSWAQKMQLWRRSYWRTANPNLQESPQHRQKIRKTSCLILTCKMRYFSNMVIFTVSMAGRIISFRRHVIHEVWSRKTKTFTCGLVHVIIWTSVLNKYICSTI